MGLVCTFWVLHDLPETLLIVGGINDSDILNVFQTSGRRNIECNVRPKFDCCTQFNSFSLSLSLFQALTPLLHKLIASSICNKRLA